MKPGFYKYVRLQNDFILMGNANTSTHEDLVKNNTGSTSAAKSAGFVGIREDSFSISSEGSMSLKMGPLPDDKDILTKVLKLPFE